MRAGRRSFLAGVAVGAGGWLTTAGRRLLAAAQVSSSESGGSKPEPIGPSKEPWIPAGKQLHARIRRMPTSLAVPTDPADVPAWHERARQAFTSLLAVDAEQPPTPDVRVVHQFRKGDLRVSQLAVTPPQEPGPWEAILLEPADADRRRPAWVCAHGYIPGGMSAVTGLIDATPGGKESLKRYECDYGYQLAKRGYVTLSFHCPGFGSRSDGQPGDTVENKLVHGALHAGFPYLGWCVSDAMACVSVLRDWPTVALERVGLIGFSMGATIAAWTAAVDDRVSAAVYSGRVASLRARALRGRHLGMLEYLPGGIYPQMDKPDTLAVTAPKPMWVSQEVRDDFPVARSRVAPIKRAYEAMDAADRLTVYFDERGVHKFVGRRAYRWIETLWPL